MGPERLGACVNSNKLDDLPVPPGFVSHTSFTLKRLSKIEETCIHMAFEREFEDESTQMMDTASNTVDLAKFKTYMRRRPWILHNQLNHRKESEEKQIDLDTNASGERSAKRDWSIETVADTENIPLSYGSCLICPNGILIAGNGANVPLKVSLPKGVISGCSSRSEFRKVSASWHPEEARIPTLDEVPVFHPTKEEFKDLLEYVASIRPRAEKYGICRIVPPPSWQPPCLIEEKNVWETSRFCTHIQRIDELQNVHSKRAFNKFKEMIEGERRGMDHDETGYTEGFEFVHGPEFTLATFKKYADYFKRKYFGMKNIVKDSDINLLASETAWKPTIENIEGEYRRIVENPSKEIEVFHVPDLESGIFGSGFPLKSNSLKGIDYPEYVESDWNLNNTNKLPVSLLSFESCDTSSILLPRLHIGMCFSSDCWKVEEHHLYSLSYMHLGAPKIWYGIPGKYAFQFEAFLKKKFPDLSEHPEVLHKLVTQLSPAALKSEGIPVFRCVQHPREFVLVLPGAYHSGFDCGFNCSEAVNFAPFDWLPHGQNVTELYSERCRKTSISFDKVLLEASMVAVRALWDLLTRKSSPLIRKWKAVCGKDGILTKTFMSRVKLEAARREFLCNSSQSRKMESDFDSSIKRECFICFYDLHLSASGCSCSPDRYTCLNHTKHHCSCPLSARFFLFRYELHELDLLVEALGFKFNAIERWVNGYLGPKHTFPISTEEVKQRDSHALSENLNAIDASKSNTNGLIIGVQLKEEHISNPSPGASSDQHIGQKAEADLVEVPSNNLASSSKEKEQISNPPGASSEQHIGQEAKADLVEVPWINLASSSVTQSNIILISDDEDD